MNEQDYCMSPAAEQIAQDHGIEARPAPARLDADRTARPFTRIVHHPPHGGCVSPHMPLVAPEYEDEHGKRTPLTDATPAEPVRPTPEVVLRTMLSAYETAATEAEAEHRSQRTHETFVRIDYLNSAVYFLRNACDMHISVAVDYAARLSGAKPLSAPPPDRRRPTAEKP